MLNNVQLIGRLGKDPDMRFTPNGDGVASFSLALAEKWKTKDGEKKERTTWVDIVAWRKLAEIAAEHLRKGSKVYVEGKLQKREWEAEDGGKRSKMEVVARVILFLDSKNKGDGAPSEPGADFDDFETPF